MRLGTLLRVARVEVCGRRIVDLARGELSLLQAAVDRRHALKELDSALHVGGAGGTPGALDVEMVQETTPIFFLSPSFSFLLLLSSLECGLLTLTNGSHGNHHAPVADASTVSIIDISPNTSHICSPVPSDAI